MKKIIVLLLIVILLSACRAIKDNNEYRFNAFLIQYKINNSANAGVIGAENENRIYYFSQENNISGIYSMKNDGSDIKFETEARDIQKIQANNGEIYYLSFEKVSYGVEGEQWGNKFYSIKSLDLENYIVNYYYKVENSVKDIIEEYRKGAYRGIWDFYYLGDDKFILKSVDATIPVNNFRLKNYFMNIQGSVCTGYDFQKIKFILDGVKDWLYFYKPDTDDYIILSKNTIEKDESIEYEDFIVYDIAKNSGFTVWDSSISYTDFLMIYFIDKGKLIAGGERNGNNGKYNYIIEYDFEKEKVVKKCKIDGAETVILFDKKYILAKFKNREEIYSFNEADFTMKKLLSNKKGYIVDIRDNYYILLDKGNLYKKDLSGKDIWKIKLDKNYIKNEHKVEVTGDWLFIKSFDLKEEQAYLEEKINIKTGERVDTGLNK